jgi:hypothetical protein
MLSRRAAVVFGAADALTAIVVVVGVFAGLPSRCHRAVDEKRQGKREKILVNGPSGG